MYLQLLKVLSRVHKAGYNVVQLIGIQEHAEYSSVGYKVFPDLTSTSPAPTHLRPSSLPFLLFCEDLYENSCSCAMGYGLTGGRNSSICYGHVPIKELC